MHTCLKNLGIGFERFGPISMLLTTVGESCCGYLCKFQVSEVKPTDPRKVGTREENGEEGTS